MSAAYHLAGPANAPVVMFGNGLGTAMAMWQRQAAHFPDRYRVLRYDVRGHGGSATGPAPYTLEELADDAAGLLDVLGIRRATYVGLSLGGEIGQVLAARHPERVGALVLCATTMRNRWAMWEQRIAAVQAGGLEPQVEPAMERWFTPRFRDAHPDLVKEMRRMMLGTSVTGYLGCAAAMRDGQLEELAARLRQPTLIVAGEHDRAAPPDEPDYMHRAIAGSRLAMIENAAHLPNIEQAPRFNAVLGNFLAAHAV